MRILSVLLFGLICSPLLGQTLLKEGKLFYDITYQNLPPEMKRNEHLLPHEASFYFKDQRTRMEMGLAGMGKNTTIYNGYTRETIVLLNIFSKKLALKKSDSEMVAFKKEMVPDSLKLNFKVSILNEYKKIAGYNCQKAQVIRQTIYDTSINYCWFTRDILPYNTQNEQGLKEIPGFLMQYSSDNNGVVMQLTVKMVSPVPIEDKMFEIPTTYQVVSDAEFKRLLPLLQSQQHQAPSGK
jgi:GLPGLI family protein